MKSHNLPNGFVYLHHICPSILIDIRYATTNNFTNSIVPGYFKNVAILTKEAGNAINSIQKDLQKQGLSLLIWDAYRPQTAVNYFLNWKYTPDEKEVKNIYYPEYTKKEIFDLGFIRGRSSHSRGSTVDLTIIDIETKKPINMGTDFDFFGKKAHTVSNQVPSNVSANRLKLRSIMRKYGFVNTIEIEWWHYSFENEPYTNTYFDFPVI
jgi:D-alanyl-D-alanine dipeptidase